MGRSRLAFSNVRVQTMANNFDVRKDDLTHPQTRSLLEYHLRQMHAASPPGSVFALDLSGLQARNISVWSVWSQDRVACVGALKELDSSGGELKSMRTHPDFLRKGAASVLLDHIIATARERGFKRLSLETGSGPSFEPALSLYRRRGFNPGEPFGGYNATPFNQFFHLDL